MVQSLASVTSGEVISAVVREESHPAHLHPQGLSVREEIGEELLYQPVMLSHWTQRQVFFLLYCIWVQSPWLGLYHVWQRTQVNIFPLGLGHIDLGNS